MLYQVKGRLKGDGRWRKEGEERKKKRTDEKKKKGGEGIRDKHNERGKRQGEKWMRDKRGHKMEDNKRKVEEQQMCSWRQTRENEMMTEKEGEGQKRKNQETV